MSQTPELPNVRGNNPRDGMNSDSESQNQMIWADSPENQQIIWEDSDDVYKPIPQTIKDFKSARGIEEEDSLTKVYIKTHALQTLTAHLGSNLQIEQGGILFGNAYQDPTYGIYVEITAAVPAPATIGTGAHLDFTPESWLGIMDYAKHQHPQENIVGWYHSHPGLSVFMSGTDMNTQRAFFYHPWCLSIVCDPVRKTIGYFLGESATPVKPVIWPHPIKRPPSPPAQHQSLLTPPQTDITSLPNEADIPQEQIRETRRNNILAIESMFPMLGTLLSRKSRNHEGDNQQDESSNISSNKPQNKEYTLTFVLLLLALLLAFLAAVTGGLIVTTLSSNNNQNTSSESSTLVATQPSLKVDAYIITMPSKLWNQIQNRNLLKSQVIKLPGKIGSGDEIALLGIGLPEQRENAERFQLEIQEITLPDEEVLLPNNAASFKSLKNLADISNENYTNNANLLIKTLPLETLSKDGVVLIPIYSSHPGKNDNETEAANKSQRLVRDVIYIPRKLIYTDREKNQQKIDIEKIINYGDESR